MSSGLWDCEMTLAEDLGIHVPAWVSQDIQACDIAAINQGGCASGAYMPAVTYHDASKTMEQHGDAVLQYLQDTLGELPKPSNDESWSGMAVFFLSAAVELWASGVEAEIEQELSDRHALAEEGL